MTDNELPRETKQILAKDVQAGMFFEDSEITHVRKWDDWCFLWSGLWLLIAKQKHDTITVEVPLVELEVEDGSVTE